MPQPGRHFFASARGRLLFFNLLVVAVTLMVSGVAVLGFQHASQIQEQVQQQTVDDMTGSMNLARDTANVATAAVRLSQVVGALEYKGEAERLQETQRALKQSLEQLATAPLAQQEPVLVERIIQRSNELQSSVEGMLQRGQRRHLERNALLSSLYQNQSYLRHLQKLTGAQDDALLGQMDRLIVAAIDTPTPRSVVKQLDAVMPALPLRHASPLISGILNDFNQELHKLEPLSSALEQSDLAINWYMFHIKALVAILNSDINQYASQVALISEQRVAQSHQELQSGALFILVFALLAVVITGFAGWYIYRNLGSNLTAISRAMTRLAHGESDVSVPALQRRDELGELARAFSVFARNTASLEHTTRLLKEKTSQMEIDRTERQGLEEALLHSQKLKAVGQLTGGLAHDFNNLLAVIIGSLDLVNPESPDAPRVNRALKAAERGALLTQRLLAFSRKQSLHPHAVELKTLLEKPLQALQQWAAGRPELQALCQQYSEQAQSGTQRLLPGPTGERNTLTLMPRERVLCVADNEQDALIQLAAVLAVGCEVLWPDSALQRDLAKKLPREVSERIRFAKAEQLPGQAFDAVIYHGDSDQLRELCEQVAARDGAIVSVQGFARGETNLLLERLYIERSLSVNTAAAGGNASLMTIG